MTVMRAIDTAASGLSAQQVKLEAVADNLANSTTPGFKSATTVEFQALLSETLRPGSKPEGTLGGVNPLQIGTGVEVAGIHRDYSQGAIGITGASADLAVDGIGFFILKEDSGGRLYTRDGTFSLDAQDRLVDPATGMAVQGLNADLATFTVPGVGTLQDLVIPVGDLVVGGATLTGFSVGADGTITGIFSDSTLRTLGRVGLARFSNPDGLEHRGGPLFRAGTNSGPALEGAPGTGGFGTLAGGALEASNVDFVKEFTDLISAQRAFQANARVIARSEELLEGLVNIV